MKLVKESVYNGIVDIGPKSSVFSKGLRCWLFWNGESDKWEWGNHQGNIKISPSTLNKCTIYYFIYDGLLKSLWFVCAYDIRSALWIEPDHTLNFNGIVKNYIHGDQRPIGVGETLYFFVYDTKAPYIRKVTYPQETISQKSWRILSYINPFSK